jgi:hypothetical protein
MRSPTLLLLGLLLAGDLGCAGAEGLTRTAVPAALDESVAFLEDPDSQQRLQRLMSDPQVQDAARQLTSSLVDGALAGLSDEERQAELRKVSARYVEAVSAAAAKSLRDEFGPAAAEAAGKAVSRVMSAALAPRVQRDVQAMTEELTRRTIDALSQSASRGLQKDLGPAMRAVIEDELGPAMRTVIARDLTPALREALTGELVPAIGLVAREATRQIVLGAHDGLEEIQFRERFGTFELNFWNRLDALIHRGLRASTIAAWALGVIVLILSVLFGRAMLLRRRLDEERLRSERMLLSVMHGLQQGSDKPDIEAFLHALRERDPDLADDSYLEELARRVAQPGRRYGRPRRRL